MKQNNPAVILGMLALAILAIVAGSIFFKRQSASYQSSNAKVKVPMETNQSVVSSAVHEAQQLSVLPASDEPAVAPPAQPEVQANPKTPTPAKKASGGKKVIQDPIAREALAWAGADPYAEEYWFAALDNPALSESERQDLVDDLNEEGLPDPKHPTIDDLPLLLARVELLEEAARHFGDRYEFEEPYRDLAQLIRIALGSDEIVH